MSVYRRSSVEHPNRVRSAISTGNTLGKGRMQMGTPEGNVGLLQEITADRMALLLLMAGIILWLAALGRHAMLNKMNKLKGI